MSAGNHLPNLDKIFKEDDEADFFPSTGSNLAAIFGMQSKMTDLHAPAKQQAHKKKPKSASAQPVQISKTEVIIAKPVYAFKLRNDTHVPMGKLGMALTGNVMQKAYQIILYKSKQEHISVATVTSDFMYTVQENNYSSYYDSNNENWSILFESLDISIEFAREIAMARYLSMEGRAHDILYQDLTPIAKDINAKEGDNISIKYFIATEIVQPFKHTSAIPQTMTVEISTDDNWERVLLGTTKGLRRSLFLPPSKQISLGPGFPKEKNIMFEIEITEIKALEEKSEVSKTGNSNNKATILSRMAKVGQSMLPKINTVTSVDSEDTDSEDNVSQKSPQQKKESLGTVLQKRNILQEHSEEVSKSLHKSSHSMDETTSSYPAVTAVQASYGQMSSVQPHTVPLAIPTVMDQGLNLMLSETRMANTELRMGMYKISDNIQKLLDKFHAFELQNATSPSTDKISMDATLKMLIAMSASQVEKKETEAHKEPVEIHNVSASNTIEIQELKQEILDLKIQLKDAIERLLEKECYIKNAETEKESLMTVNQNLVERIADLQRSLNSANDALVRTQEDLQEIKSFNSEYHKMVTEIRDQISKCQVTSDTGNGTSSKSADAIIEKDQETKNKEIKCIMNKTYQTLLEKFEDGSYSTDYIKSTIGSTIKNITLLVLGESQEQLAKYSEETGRDEVDEFSEEEIQLKETPQSSDIPAIQDEPPPIPPNDTDMESD